MEKFYSFLELCAGTVLLKSYSGREFLCRHGTKIWSIAHASICDYIYCNLINVHKEFCFFFLQNCVMRKQMHFDFVKAKPGT